MYESIIAFDADAHAETVAKFGPLKPYLIAIRPGHMSGINLGIKNGLNLGFLSFSLKLISSFWNVSIPPTPDPHITPILDKSIFSRFSSESFTASSAAIIPN